VFLQDVSEGLQFLADNFLDGLVDFLTCGTGELDLGVNVSFGASSSS
jgi:hypothetical protein